MVAYLQDAVCLDCGESDAVVLEFDHVKGVKLFNISDSCGRSWKSTLKEIEKCEIVCANCHRRRTAKRGNHYRDVAQR